jgi:hypothetical protein
MIFIGAIRIGRLIIMALVMQAATVVGDPEIYNSQANNTAARYLCKLEIMPVTRASYRLLPVTRSRKFSCRMI